MKAMNRIRSWIIPVAAQAKISRLNVRIDKLDSERKSRERSLQQRESELRALATRMEQDLKDAQRTNARYEFALEEVREQNRILETTIQTLVAANQLHLERYDTETAIQVRNRVAASMPSPRE